LDKFLSTPVLGYKMHTWWHKRNCTQYFWNNFIQIEDNEIKLGLNNRKMTVEQIQLRNFKISAFCSDTEFKSSQLHDCDFLLFMGEWL